MTALLASRTAGGLAAAATGLSLLHAAHWRRRAREHSPAEIEQNTNALLAELLTADRSEGHGLVAYYLIEAQEPPEGDRRWFWWVAATCSVCDSIHDPLTGYAESRRAGHACLTAATDFFTDPDSCPNPDGGDA